MNAPMWSNFTGFPNQSTLNQNFSDTTIKSSEEQKATYEKVATYCNNWYAPIFSDEKPTIPETISSTIIGTGVVEVVPVDLKSESEATKPKESSKDLTIPPIKIEQSDLLNAVLIGLGVVFVIKILQ